MTDRLLLYRKPGLYLATAGRKGRGVFCENPIAQDEVIEVTPALICDVEDTRAVQKTIFGNYTFGDDDAKSDAALLAMGIVSFCNHLAEANAAYEKQRTPDGVFFTLRAIADIPADTEICINYGLTWFATRRDA